MPPNDFPSPDASSAALVLCVRGARNAGSGTFCSIARPAIAATSTTFGRIGSVSRRQTPVSPVGENTIKPTKSRPKNQSQCGVQIDKYSRNRM